MPGFLPAVPGTGMRGYPEYRYFVGEEARRYDENPWVLYLSAPIHIMGFDKFLYFPRQNYPRTGYGGGLERIGDRAYVHE